MKTCDIPGWLTAHPQVAPALTRRAIEVADRELAGMVPDGPLAAAVRAASLYVSRAVMIELEIVLWERAHAV